MRNGTSYLDVKVEVVTPEKAKAWLADAAANRAISEGPVRRYAGDMLSGRYMLNGQTIVFSDDGKLRDGRHRLSAVIAADVEIEMLIVRGVKPEAFETMDSGRSRTLNNVLSIEGHKHTAVTGAAARIVWAYVAGTNLKYAPSRSELLTLIREHPLLEQSAARVGNSQFARSVPKSALAALLTLATRDGLFEAKAAEFLRGFLDGEGLFRGDARLTLRRWLERERREAGLGGVRISEPFFAAATKAWNSFAKDEKIIEIRLPSFFNIETLPIAGFKRDLWGNVPDLRSTSFARLSLATMEQSEALRA